MSELNITCFDIIFFLNEQSAHGRFHNSCEANETH